MIFIIIYPIAIDLNNIFPQKHMLSVIDEFSLAGDPCTSIIEPTKKNAFIKTKK